MCGYTIYWDMAFAVYNFRGYDICGIGFWGDILALQINSVPLPISLPFEFCLVDASDGK